jgi:tRNA nucleotidyltransferase (CCA-adding enzyme)
MEVYLVGGAVRDELLGRPVTERDWVVVGAAAQELLDAGYRQVGRDFPVFLHPETGEEYALARTERKTGPGHQGFAVHADPTVALEDDLARRDLTINAMARAQDGTLVDPFGGRADLAARVLRHVSPAFEEDPLRVFRVARFAARLPEFEVAVETCRLMATMAERDALSELSAERVWVELAKALAGTAPGRFVTVLRDCGALEPWFVEFEGTAPGPAQSLAAEPERFAAYVGNLAEDGVRELAGRLKAPKAHTRLAVSVVRHRRVLAGWRGVGADELFRALSECRAFKPGPELRSTLAVIGVLEGVDLASLLEGVDRIIEDVQPGPLQAKGLKGRALGEALDAARRAELEKLQAAG